MRTVRLIASSLVVLTGIILVVITESDVSRVLAVLQVVVGAVMFRQAVGEPSRSDPDQRP